MSIANHVHFANGLHLHLMCTAEYRSAFIIYLLIQFMNNLFHNYISIGFDFVKSYDFDGLVAVMAIASIAHNG